MRFTAIILGVLLISAPIAYLLALTISVDYHNWICAGFIGLDLALAAIIAHRSGAVILGPHFYWDAVRLYRKDRTFLIRTLYGLGLLLCLYWAHGRVAGIGIFAALWRPAIISVNAEAALAELFVHSIMAVQMAAVLILTPAYTAGTIAEERERKTLELLFSTALECREIILGKLCGRVWLLTSLLLASFPVLALTQFFGGVSMQLLLMDVVIVWFTLLLVGSLSIFISTLSPSVWGAVIATYAIILLLGILLIKLPWPPPGMLMSPMNSLATTGRATLLHSTISLQDPMGTIWEVGLSHTAVSLLLMAGAVLTLRTGPRWLWKLRAAASAFAKSLTTGSGGRGLSVEQAPGPLPPIFRWPLLWKEMFLSERINPRRSFRVLVTLGILLILFLIHFLSGMDLHFDEYGTARELSTDRINSVRGLVTFLAGLVCLGVGVHAAGSVVRERQARTLDSLLCLPGQRSSILAAKWCASLCRPGLSAYAFIAVMILGFLVWALDPKAAPWLVIVLIVHAAFAASLGLFISTLATTRTWANFVLALVLFSLCIPGLFIYFFPSTSEPDLLSNVLSVGINPVASWWYWTNNWMKGEGVQPVQLTAGLIGVSLFGMAAYVLWVAARWRF